MLFFIFEAILGFMFLIVVMGKLIISDCKRYRGKGTIKSFYIKKFFYQLLMIILGFFLLVLMLNQANFILFLICLALVVGFYYYMLTLSHNNIPKNRYVNLGILILCMITIALDRPLIFVYVLCIIALVMKIKKAYDKALTEPVYAESYIHTNYKDEQYNCQEQNNYFYQDDEENNSFFEAEQNDNWNYEEEENDFWDNNDSSSWQEEDNRQQFDQMDPANVDWNSVDFNDISF